MAYLLAFLLSSCFQSTIGSIATEYSDVGRYAEEDRCCREHDLCPQQLLPGECKRGLCNQQPFTRSHCDCDMKFRRCLQQLNTGSSKYSHLFTSLQRVNGRKISAVWYQTHRHTRKRDSSNWPFDNDCINDLNDRTKTTNRTAKKIIHIFVGITFYTFKCSFFSKSKCLFACGISRASHDDRRESGMTK